MNSSRSAAATAKNYSIPANKVHKRVSIEKVITTILCPHEDPVTCVK
jgi:hypothetical protein